MSGEGGKRRRGEEGGRIVDECLEPAKTGRGKGPSTLGGYGHCVFFYYQIFYILLYVTNCFWVYYIVGPPEADSSEPVLNMI